MRQASLRRNSIEEESTSCLTGTRVTSFILCFGLMPSITDDELKEQLNDRKTALPQPSKKRKSESFEYDPTAYRPFAHHNPVPGDEVDDLELQSI